MGRLSTLLALTLLLSGPLIAQESGEEAANSAPAACECLWQGSFSEVASQTDLVALATVTRTRGNAMDLALERIISGPDWLETVRVWLKARDYCRPDVDTFPEGSRWLLALNTITDIPEGGFNPSTPNISFGRVGDYALSACGGYYLRSHGDTAQGNLVPGMPRWEYSPEMTPVMTDLIAEHLQGDVPVTALVRASKEDPEVRDLMLDTRSFLRGQDEYLDSDQ